MTTDKETLRGAIPDYITAGKFLFLRVGSRFIGKDWNTAQYFGGKLVAKDPEGYQGWEKYEFSDLALFLDCLEHIDSSA